jgi:hypothetical protein
VTGHSRDRRIALRFAALLLSLCGLPGLGLLPLVASPPEVASILEGRVTDAAGQRLPGVTVTALPAAVGTGVRTTTGPEGTYRLPLPAGSYRVDHELHGFDLIRYNGVLVDELAVVRLDVNLPVSAVCECVDLPPGAEGPARVGQVLDDTGRPLPHAQLELASSSHRFRNYADHEGRFQLRLPAAGTWTLTALDTGFASETRQLAAAAPESIAFRLMPAPGASVRNVERIVGPCCAVNLLTWPSKLR